MVLSKVGDSLPTNAETRMRADEMQLLMERIRQRSAAPKSWDELANIAKKNMMEKRNVLDADDRAQLQESMALLQRTRHVTSRKDLIAQLKDIATGVDLKWTPEKPSAVYWLSADTFFVELKFASDSEDSTTVAAVQIGHGSDQSQPSTLICSLINEFKWVQLSEQLAGLFRFYPASADSDTKSLVFKSLCCVEADLRAHSQRFKTSNAVDAVNSTPIGVSRPRDGGRPFRLHILLNPYDLIDSKCTALLEPTVDDILEKEMGRFVELVVAAGTDKYLPKETLIVGGNDWREIDASCTHIDETTNKPRPLAACLALCSVEPFILTSSTIAEIEKATGETLVVTKRGNVLNMLTDAVTDGLVVHLPDQSHKYLIDISAHKGMDGGQVTDVHFVHPRQAVAAVAAIRRQLLFNDVFRSCVRPTPAQQSDFSGVRFDLSCPKVGRIDCLFERPHSDSEKAHVIIAKFYFTCSADMSVTVEAVLGEKIEPEVGNAATITFKKTWSVPVTMRTVLNKLGYSNESNTDKGDGGGQKDMKFKMDFDDNDAEPSADEDDEEPMDHMDNGHQTQHGGDRFWLSLAPSVVELRKKTGTSWLSTPYRPRAKHIPVAFHVIPIEESTNLLDMFKEIDIVTELIPPRANQEPLKSPTPMHTPTLGHGQMPSPRLQDMLGNPSISRTQSETTMALNAFSDLEALCGDLANNDGMSVGDSASMGGTPSSDHSRRSSLVDGMAQSPTLRAPLTPGGFSSSIFPGLPPASSAAEFAAQQHRMMQAAMNRPGGMMMQQPPPLSPGAAASNMRQRHLSAVGSGSLCQSKSVDYDFMGQPVSNTSGDPFAFQDADDSGGPPKLSAPGSAGLYSQQPQPFTFPGQYTNPPSGKGSRGAAAAGTVKRRGRGRKAGNLGDRAQSVDGEGLAKPPRKPRVAPTGTRKPRKPRGAVAATGMLHTDLANSSRFGASPNYGALPSTFSVDKVEAPGTPFSMSDMQFPPALISQKSEPLGGLDMERQSSDEDSRSSANNSSQKKSAIKTELSEVRRGDQSSSILESLVNDNSDSRPESASSASSKTQQRVKPNILTKSAGSRKGSLDAVIGKLRARNTNTMADVYDDEIGATDAGDGRFDEENSRDSVFAAESASAGSSADAESAPATSESTELKVVIKKTLLKTPSPAQVKPQLARQKSSEVPSGEKSAAKQRLQQTIKAKSDEKKPKGQKRKANDSPRDGKSSKPRLDAPNERKSSIDTGMAANFPGSEGITFALNKSLKNFKIPKVVEESREATKAPPPFSVSEFRPVAAPSLSTPSAPSMLSATSLLNRQPVKSILKQPSISSVMPPPLESPTLGSFRPAATGRKPLLPSPPVHQPMRMPPTLTPRPPPFLAPSSSGQPPAGGYNPDFWGNETLDDQVIRSPDDTSIRSPDQSGFTIDETVRSPVAALNTSKDSGDRSPELKIVENE